MPLSTIIVAMLALAAGPEEAPITVRGYPWAPFISPMGEPFRGGRTDEPPIVRWFNRADLDHDGLLTREELQADADRFFTRRDSNHDGQSDPDERKAYELEIAPEIQVNSEWRRPRGSTKPQPTAEDASGDWPRKPKADGHDGYRTDGLQGAARYGLLNIPQPVASADADFNRAITQAEFRQAAQHRFTLLDSRGEARITLAELEARLPTRPEGKRAKRSKDERDVRIGQPLPQGE